MSNRKAAYRPWWSFHWAVAATVAAVVRETSRLRLWWLLPMIVLLLMMAIVLALIGAAGPLAPFVYPLF